jgi:hypothetical protein
MNLPNDKEIPSLGEELPRSTGHEISPTIARDLFLGIAPEKQDSAHKVSGEKEFSSQAASTDADLHASQLLTMLVFMEEAFQRWEVDEDQVLDDAEVISALEVALVFKGRKPRMKDEYLRPFLIHSAHS